MPRARPVSSADSSSCSSGPSRRTTWALSQALSRASTLSRAGPVELLVGEDAQARLEQLVARLELGHRIARASGPTPSFESTSVASAAAREALGPGLDLARQRLARRRCAASWPRSPSACGSGTNWKPCRWPTCCPSTVTSPVGRDFRFQHRVLSQAPHQHARAPVDEALGQPLVQRVRQPVLYPTRHRPANAPGPAASRAGWRRRSRCGPARCGCDSVSMSPSVRSTSAHVAREPVVRDRAVLHQEAVELRRRDRRAPAGETLR